MWSKPTAQVAVKHGDSGVVNVKTCPEEKTR